MAGKSMKVRLLDMAQFELDEAIEFYNYENPGLGEAFLDEFLRGIGRIKDFPEAWQPCSKQTRRCLIRRFPYGIIYKILKNEILVVAVAHLHRKPDYWRDRI